LLWLVKSTTQLCTSKKSNKLDLIAPQYFLLVDHNDWSRWFGISSPPRMWGSSWWGYQNKKAKLRHLILLSRVMYWATVEMFLVVPFPPGGPSRLGCLLAWTLVLAACFFFSPFLGCLHFIKFGGVSHQIWGPTDPK
jgi:hypothetical protein